MVRHGLFGLVMICLLFLGAVPRAAATDGHFLHGVGAINSAMGGVGIAGAKDDVLGALYHNPAGFAKQSGTVLVIGVGWALAPVGGVTLEALLESIADYGRRVIAPRRPQQ